MAIFARLIIISAAMLSLNGCLPRGETITLDEVYTNAKKDFSRVDTKSVPAPSSDTLGKLIAKLNELGEAGDGFDYTGSTKEVADALTTLADHAGYTSRASLGELAKQYRLFTPAAEVSATRSKTKLLVARTYSLIQGELETTKFGL